MRFVSLKVENFLSLGSVTLDFSPGIHLIRGVNRDMPDEAESNGAGKSSLLEALSWVLFGSLHRGQAKANDVVNRVVGKDCLVELVFEHRGDTYAIRRTRAHSEFGDSLEFWCNDVTLTGHKVSDTNTLIEEALPISQMVFDYGVMVGQAFPHRFMSMSEPQKRELLSSIVELDVYDVAQDRVKAELGEISQESSRIDGAILATRQAEERKTSEIRSLQEDLKLYLSGDIAAKKASLEAEIAEADLALVEAEKGLQQWQSYREEQKARISSSRERLSQCQESVRKLSNQKARLEGEVAASRAPVQKLQSLGERCPTCGQEVPPESLVEAEKLAEEAERGLLDELAELAPSLEEAQLQQAGILGEIHELEKCRDEGDAGVSSSHEAVRSWTSHQKALATHLKEIEARQGSLEEQIRRAEGEARELARQVRDWEKKKRSEEKRQKHWNFWRVELPRVKASALEGVLEYLNGRVAHYMEVFSGGALSVSLFQKKHGKQSRINVDLQTPAGAYSLSSGGERRRVDLALYLSVADLVAVSSGTSTNLLVADEITDGLSGSGVQRFLEVLREKATDGKCVYVVSHDSAVEASGGFDSVLTVEKSGGVALLREEVLV